MELVNSVTGADEEGQSRQRVLVYAAKRYCQSYFLTLFTIYFDIEHDMFLFQSPDIP